MFVLLIASLANKISIKCSNLMLFISEKIEIVFLISFCTGLLQLNNNVIKQLKMMIN